MAPLRCQQTILWQSQRHIQVFDLDHDLDYDLGDDLDLDFDLRDDLDPDFDLELDPRNDLKLDLHSPFFTLTQSLTLNLT